MAWLITAVALNILGFVLIVVNRFFGRKNQFILLSGLLSLCVAIYLYYAQAGQSAGNDLFIGNAMLTLGIIGVSREGRKKSER